MVQTDSFYISIDGLKTTIIDGEDFYKVMNYVWRPCKQKSSEYAVARNSGDGYKQLLMHRIIMDAKDGEIVDHINHNGLDNRKCNLRICTNVENIRNARKSKANKSGYRGVHKRWNHWRAQIHFNRKTYHLGDFKDKIDAAKAYDKKATELFGEYASLNFQNSE